VIRAGIGAYAAKHPMPTRDWKALRAVMACRTPALGGHLFKCLFCGKEHFVPHSCRNRHCPTCQVAHSIQWLSKQAGVLLPIPYFHLVFTLPHDLNPLIQQNRTVLYNLLFQSVSATLLEFGHNHLHAQIGITAVLHTWGRTLIDHYHLHCIVTGGGWSESTASWVAASPRWLFAVRALSVVFRGKFLKGLEQHYQQGKLSFHGELQSAAAPQPFARLLRHMTRHRWSVYAKRPFPGAEAVLAYLSRYTHRVGISNNRLRALDTTAGTVTFEYKDYADGSRHKLLTLDLDEFIRRFRLHLLPEKFVKIRHYGLLANRGRKERIHKARAALGVKTRPDQEPDSGAAQPTDAAPAPLICPHCGKPTLELLRFVSPRAIFQPVYLDSS
jgi:hypothetical protein